MSWYYECSKAVGFDTCGVIFWGFATIGLVVSIIVGLLFGWLNRSKK